MINDCVILDGKIINIGTWEDNGDNPMPEGAIIEQRDFECDPDRGWYWTGDHSTRITELKQLLLNTDYAVIKIVEGVATVDEYADIIAQRKAWREEINQLKNSVD